MREHSSKRETGFYQFSFRRYSWGKKTTQNFPPTDIKGLLKSLCKNVTEKAALIPCNGNYLI